MRLLCISRSQLEVNMEGKRKMAGAKFIALKYGQGKNSFMNAKTYKHERRRRGTKPEVAALLGVHPYTIDKRERATLRVNREAELALLSLPVQPGLAPKPRIGRPKLV